MMLPFPSRCDLIKLSQAYIYISAGVAAVATAAATAAASAAAASAAAVKHQPKLKLQSDHFVVFG